METNKAYREMYKRELLEFIQDFCMRHQMKTQDMFDAIKKWSNADESVPFITKDITSEIEKMIYQNTIKEENVNEEVISKVYIAHTLSFFERKIMMKYLYDLETDIRISAEHGKINTLHVDSDRYKITKLYDVFFSYDVRTKEIFVDLEIIDGFGQYNHIRNHYNVVYLERKE